MISKEEYEALLRDREWDGFDEFNLPCPECGFNDVSLYTYSEDEDDEDSPYRVGRFRCKRCGWSLPDMETDCKNCQALEGITAAYLSCLRNEDND